MASLNVGVIGYGLSAKVFHVPFITTTPGLVLHAIVQRNPQPSNSAPADHPSIRHYTSSQTLLADPAVHVVVITSTPDSHFELTRQALLAGKHVLTEKPFVPSSAQADALAALARQERRILCVYQNRRWDADYLLAKHIIATGALGSVLDFNTHFDRFKAAPAAGWKGELGVSNGGSVLFDLGSHLIDQAYALFGMPRAVRGRLLTQRRGPHDPEHPDALAAELVYEGALLVHIRASQQSVEAEQPRFWIRGDKGSFRSLDLDPQETQLLAGMKPSDEGYGVLAREKLSLTKLDEAGKPVRCPVPEVEAQTYRAFYGKFAESLRSGREEDVPVRAEEAADVLRIIEGIVESDKTGRDVLF